MFRKRNLFINVTLVIILGVVGFFGWHTLYPTAAVATVQTATVSVQDVSTSVSATGSVQSALDLGLNFAASGIVRTLNVAVGDKVKKGQLLAAVDDRAAKLALLQAQVSEQTAETSVTNAQTSVTNAQTGVTIARVAIDAGAQSADATQAANDQAIINAQAALDKLVAGPTSATLAQQAQQLASAQLSIDNAIAAVTSSQVSEQQTEANVALNLAAYNRSIDRTKADFFAKCALLGWTNDEANCSESSYATSLYRSYQDAQQSKVVGVIKDAQSVTNAKTAIDNANRSVVSAQASLASLKAQLAVTNQPASQIDIDTANANIATAKRNKENAAVTAAQQATQALGSLQTAQGSLVNAQGSLVNAQGSLKISKASLANAHTNVANTRLVAPVSATVAAVASAVGVNAGITTAGAGGGSGYIVLTDLSGLQVSASFAEADIVSLQVGQAASFTFDAIANSTATGEVLAIAPLSNSSTGTGSLMTYTVTFSLVGVPDGVKPGMTAQVSVVTAQAFGVLAVTSTALTERGNFYTVILKPTTVGGVGVRKTVTVGLKGDSATEITSGLKVGDQLVIRSTTGSSASNGFPTITGVPGGTGIGGGAGAGPGSNG